MSALFIWRSSSQPSYVQEPNFSSHLWMSKGNQRTSTLHVLIKIPEKKTKEDKQTGGRESKIHNQLTKWQYWPCTFLYRGDKGKMYQSSTWVLQKACTEYQVACQKKNHSFFLYLASFKDWVLNSTTFIFFYIKMVWKMLHHRQECTLQKHLY